MKWHIRSLNRFIREKEMQNYKCIRFFAFITCLSIISLGLLSCSKSKNTDEDTKHSFIRNDSQAQTSQALPHDTVNTVQQASFFYANATPDIAVNKTANDSQTDELDIENNDKADSTKASETDEEQNTDKTDSIHTDASDTQKNTESNMNNFGEQENSYQEASTLDIQRLNTQDMEVALQNEVHKLRNELNKVKTELDSSNFCSFLTVIISLLAAFLSMITLVFAVFGKKQQKGKSTHRNDVHNEYETLSEKDAWIDTIQKNYQKSYQLKDISQAITNQTPATPQEPNLYQDKAAREKRLENASYIFVGIPKSIYEKISRGENISPASIILEEGGNYTSSLFLIDGNKLFLNFYRYNTENSLSIKNNDTENILRKLFKIDGELPGFIVDCKPAKVTRTSKGYTVTALGTIIVSGNL